MGSPKLFFVINAAPGGRCGVEGSINGRPSHRVVIVVPAVPLVNLSRQKVTSAFCSRRDHKKKFYCGSRAVAVQMKPYRCANGDRARYNSVRNLISDSNFTLPSRAKFRSDKSVFRRK